VRVLARAARGIRAERVQMRAMALTYISLFALVPALVVAFSVVQAFTGMERISAVVHDFLLENLAVGARESVEPYLDRFVHNTHVARAGLVGAALLFWSAYSLIGNIEAAVNDLWEVRIRRSLRIRTLVYWMAVTLGPLVLAASATVSEVAHAYLATRGSKALAMAASAVLSSFFLTLLYLFVPNARVRLRPALAGGVVAGIGWEIAKWGFAWAMQGSVRLHAIYGSVAAVPIFLTWMYLSWSIVLFGARLSFVVQNAPAFIGEGQHAARSERELAAANALLHVSTAFRAGDPAPTREHLVRRIRAGEGFIEVLEALRTAGLLKPLAGGGIVPGRAPEAITLLDVRRAVLGTDAVSADRKLDDAAEVFRQADERAAERLRGVTIGDLCEKATGSRPPGEASETPKGSGDGTPTVSQG
jgi:membrane protein